MVMLVKPDIQLTFRLCHKAMAAEELLSTRQLSADRSPTYVISVPLCGYVAVLKSDQLEYVLCYKLIHFSASCVLPNEATSIHTYS